MMPFIVYAMPRSRSYWLSRFLSYGEWVCGHDEMRHARSLDDVRAWFSQPCTGTVETAAAPFWRLLSQTKTVVLWRPVPEVVESLGRLGFDRGDMTRAMARQERKLEQIAARVPGALWVEFSDLETADGCKRVFEHCLPYKHDPAWWNALRGINMQANIPAMLRYFQAFRPQVERANAAAKAAMLADIEKRRSLDMEGVTFQQELWGTFFRDGEKLFEANSPVAGTGTNYRSKNLTLYKMMSQYGSLHITTARCNGRMFGYVLTATGPSLDVPDETIGMHLMTFASKEFPGLGMKLVKAANEALKDRGVSEVMYRVGDDQKKLGAFYRRLGAEHKGEEYLLRLH